MTRRILVVDDNELMREQLRMMLSLDGHEVEAVGDASEALAAVRDRPFHLVITDFRMPGMSGMEFLETVRSEKLPFGVILLTGFGDTKLALDAMKAGADDFVTKPPEPERLRFRVLRVLERRRMMDELEELRRGMRRDYCFHELVSKSPRMKRVFDLIQNVGPVGSTVLIFGETGTGKELVARAIHAADPRRGPFVAINCAAMQESLLESELFGHERGSFTGADRRRLGRFEQADGGTLFLDEIGDVSAGMQAKLLRVLQTGAFERVGGVETIKSDVRVVAASNKKLEDEVAAGNFRRDLFYRLNVIRVDLPPLRDRMEDVPLLAAHFLEKLAAKSTPPVTEIDHEAMQALLDYGWPGNVRELENVIKAAVAMADGSIIHLDALPANLVPASAAHRRGGGSSPIIDVDLPLPELTDTLVRHVEREYLAQLLAQCRGNVAQTARRSGLSRRSVAQKIQKYNLDRQMFRVAGEDDGGEE